MSEKVKKDLLDKKANKRFSNFIDFICGVILTNKNSIRLSQQQLHKYLRRLVELGKQNHPFG
jgi:hypothetical protein